MSVLGQPFHWKSPEEIRKGKPIYFTTCQCKLAHAQSGDNIKKPGTIWRFVLNITTKAIMCVVYRELATKDKQ